MRGDAGDEGRVAATDGDETEKAISTIKTHVIVTEHTQGSLNGPMESMGKAFRVQVVATVQDASQRPQASALHAQPPRVEGARLIRPNTPTLV
jgi:hypothetical protein